MKIFHNTNSAYVSSCLTYKISTDLVRSCGTEKRGNGRNKIRVQSSTSRSPTVVRSVLFKYQLIGDRHSFCSHAVLLMKFMWYLKLFISNCLPHRKIMRPKLCWQTFSRWKNGRIALTIEGRTYRQTGVETKQTNNFGIVIFLKMENKILKIKIVLFHWFNFISPWNVCMSV